MKAKSVPVGSERTFVLVLDQGEEAFRAITDFANKEQVSGAAVTAIGAFATPRLAGSTSRLKATSGLLSASNAKSSA